MSSAPVWISSILALLTLALAVLLARSARRERAAARRLRAAADDLEAPGGPAGSLRGEVERVGAAVAERAGDRDQLLDHLTALDRALDGIPQGVVLCGATGEVTWRNAAAAVYSEARHGDALVEAAIRELLDDAVEGLPGQRDLELFGPPRRTLVVTATPLELGGASAAMAVIEDVTEHRRLEAVRRDFVANISHELKTPVGAIALLAETLLSETDPAVRDRLAERILLEADRVGRTIEDLLTLSQIESERGPERDEVPAHLVLAEAVDRIRPAAEHRGIEIRVSEPSSRIRILGDRRQLVSALYNLLDNAVKYSDDGSQVEVRALTNGRTVDLEVQDHGIGIPRADIERIFERFYRVDQARSRQTGGTGLGLAIVRHVATNHEGDVRVSSRPGEGSTFTLRLPAAPGAVPVTTAEAS